MRQLAGLKLDGRRAESRAERWRGWLRMDERERPLSDLDGEIREQRNALERLIQRVPGFRGYFERENRREADRLLRDFGCSRLGRVISELTDATKAAPLERMGAYQETINQAEKLRNALRHADQGYSGFFQETKWDREDMLIAVYARDLELVDDIEALCAGLETADLDPEALRRELVALQRRLEDRRAAILGLARE